MKRRKTTGQDKTGQDKTGSRRFLKLFRCPLCPPPGRSNWQLVRLSRACMREHWCACVRACVYVHAYILMCACVAQLQRDLAYALHQIDLVIVMPLVSQTDRQTCEKTTGQDKTGQDKTSSRWLLMVVRCPLYPPPVDLTGSWLVSV